MGLTIGLMKNRDSNQSLQGLKDLMNNFREEVGHFLGLQKLDQQLLNANHVQQRYAMQFERCILNVDLIANPQTKTQVIKSFNLR